MVGVARAPGVYFEPRPRAEPPPAVRTDVAGFIGFEPRVRDGTTPSALSGGPPRVGHVFRVDVSAFQLEISGLRASVRAARDFVISEDPAAIPMADGESILYALLAVRNAATTALEAYAGLPGETGRALPLSDDEVRAAMTAGPLGVRPFARIADVELARSGDEVRLIVHPALPPARVDDWSDFVLQLGEPVEDGSFLAHAVRAYFANGGQRCWVETVLRPQLFDAAALDAAREEMVGVLGASEETATGLERLLLISEVSVVDVPELYAVRVAVVDSSLPVPPVAAEGCFEPCARISGAGGRAVAAHTEERREPLYSDDQVYDAQRRMVERALPERWRVLLLLTAPLQLDPADGLYHGPEVDAAVLWRDRFRADLGDDPPLSVAAFYFPWVLAQDRIDAPIVELPPTPYAAGVIARRDLARGPHVAPANETVIGVVGLSRAIDEQIHARLNESPININVLRAFPGYGVQIFGARTLSADRWYRYLPVRRCLSAIERRAHVALQPLVFEPNTTTLWLQATHMLLAILLPIFESGALRGADPAQAFYVRCDAGNNPAESVAAGKLVIEVGVAVAAPAEFIVFRIGRSEGVVEVLE